MSKLLGLVTLAMALAGQAQAVVQEWGQCGLNYTGETQCAAGLYCYKQNDWYSQCLRGTASSTSTTSTRTTSSSSTRTTSSSTSTRPPSSSTTTTRPPSSSTTTTRPPSSSTTTTSGPVATGFIRTSGQKFTLNGSTFVPVGSNAYWIPQLASTADITFAFNDLKAAGLTVLRTWGFNEVLSDPGYGTFYQIWNGATPTINTGANGLGKFDIVVQEAAKAGIRLIVALTNNWADYGGMDVYVRQILGSGNHDLFYTDARVKQAYKNYVNAFVTRYRNNPTIMAWELGNEPRCRGSTGTSTGTCTPATITAWATEMSQYIKSIDPNHLVALGDEGFFNRPGDPSYPYQGGEGIDFEANLRIASLDFGTVHAYPEHWGEAGREQAWGVQWINDHAAVQKSIGKPVILEEFGVTTNKDPVYTAWYNAIISSGLTGDLIWQAGSRMPSGTVSHDDGYTTFPGSSVYTLMQNHAAAIKARG